MIPEYVIANCSVVPVREDPSECAEQQTQLLFADACEVLDRLPRWTKIRSLLDGQEGWVDFKMLSPISASPHYTAIVSVPIAAATPMDGTADIMLTMGTRLPNYAHGTFEVSDQQYLIDPTCVRLLDIEEKETRKELITNTALSLLNTPYLWGGKNIMGMDCSGFTQVVFSVLGSQLLRNAREQMSQGQTVLSLEDAEAGDLAFFDHADRDANATNISHVGILLNPTEIIHCSGSVHIDSIDQEGIRLPNGELTHHLVQIKRIL